MKATTLAKITRNVEAAEAAQRVDISTRRLSLVCETTPANAASPSAGPIWEPVPSEHARIPTTSEVLALPPGQLAAEVEAELIALATRPLAAGESHYTGGENRERELRLMFARLTPLQAHQLRRRLDIERSDDALVISFRRLAVERRVRLKRFWRILVGGCRD